MNHLSLYLSLLAGGMSLSILGCLLGLLSWKRKASSNPKKDFQTRFTQVKKMLSQGISAPKIAQKTALSSSEVYLISKLSYKE